MSLELHKPILSFYFLFRNAWKILFYRSSIPRLLTDTILAQLLSQLSGSVVDLGSSPKTNATYRKVNPRLTYIASNIVPPYEVFVDMQNMPFGDGTVNNFLSVASLEHLPEPQRAVDEMQRTLKQDGYAIVVVPFMYRLHSLPDYFRFGFHSLKFLFRNFSSVSVYQVGDFDLTLMNMLYKKIWYWPLLCLFFVTKLFKSFFFRSSNNILCSEVYEEQKRGVYTAYPSLYLVIAQK